MPALAHECWPRTPGATPGCPVLCNYDLDGLSILRWPKLSGSAWRRCLMARGSGCVKDGDLEALTNIVYNDPKTRDPVTYSLAAPAGCSTQSS